MGRVLSRFANFIGLPKRARDTFFDVVDAHVGVPAADIDMSKFGAKLPVSGLIVHDHDGDMVPFSGSARPVTPSRLKPAFSITWIEAWLRGSISASTRRRCRASNAN